VVQWEQDILKMKAASKKFNTRLLIHACDGFLPNPEFSASSNAISLQESSPTS
jgi:hypothetical protein